MKKQAVLLAVVMLTSTSVLAAQNGGFVDPDAPAAQVKKGGFSADHTSVVTVKQAEDMKDDSWITVRGQLVKQLGDEDYQFRDQTGTMKVEIDHKRWDGQTISPKDHVELTGELDKDFNSIELDVKHVRKLP
ncbi:MAG: YgiW/YdeI family stress tolerance OB fold protein [Enterobacterales bacterium endosymbiont of Blomia tropicalis]|uniref:YgiW/YdeI family stress tolerance OB fold protein n=1 Tax=Mixta mediterraneensis TaxID=2758443 RepID=UPI0025A89B06|nr:NirD/YgiW/YdeI family stress tolerance protein [Mixta mediterraneensis]MDL4915238.1 YgiW/YdeI family stress tolerance OB fold protein [Mixta mediterraneensis]